jgi:hypothetical protein
MLLTRHPQVFEQWGRRCHSCRMFLTVAQEISDLFWQIQDLTLTYTDA